MNKSNGIIIGYNVFVRRIIKVNNLCLIFEVRIINNDMRDFCWF